MAWLKNSVFIQPGHTAITRMPCFSSSTPSAREKLSTYAFDAPYTFIYGTGCHDDIEPMLYIRLPATIYGMLMWHIAVSARAFRSMMSSCLSMSISVNTPNRPKPAALTRTEISGFSLSSRARYAAKLARSCRSSASGRTFARHFDCSSRSLSSRRAITHSSSNSSSRSSA